MEISRKRAKVLFVLSSERSGSTLLTRMLAQNDCFVSPPELWFLRYEDYDAWKRSKPEALKSLEVLGEIIRPKRSLDTLEEMLKGQQTCQIYRILSELCGNDRILVDKTPAYSNKIDILKRTSSMNAVYLWLVRHPMGVVDSEMKHAGRRAKGEGKAGFIHDAKGMVQRTLDRGMTRRARRREAKWLAQNRNIQAFLNEIPSKNQMKLQFEALLQQPESAMRGICEHLNVNYYDEMLNPFNVSVDITPGIGNPDFNKRNKLDSDMANEWKARFSAEQLRAETLSMYKYISTN